MSEHTDEKRVLSVIQEPLEIIPEPFAKFAKALNTDVDTVFETLKSFIDRGIVRRFAGIVKHNKAGFIFNAMVAFEVDECSCDEAGAKLSELSYVTHCYRRTAYNDWPYNIYAMMHARDKDEFDKRIAAMKNLFTFKSVSVLQSVKEFKKSHFLIK
jgi:DNA-binding Lrp family transcriptional regulator